MDLSISHKFEYAEPLSVEIERGQRGGYGWTIKLHGQKSGEVVDVIAKTDQKLKELFLPKVEEVKGEDKGMEHTD